ncbi:ATP phosphoribosyltransferase regulatory subunit [Anaerotalea alkaliphila]|uniref:ATP phosphoribosyltransferase regulatory subunit n=1 Tax=Anaerotalea alkaliphila TaxID=2662126 RepID=A0A7X5KNA8_9FIRM|nr:ATP phosphoribosyltransferase regulatory subunit [Anaerotalea alkaliphila]NDL68674.1 ATP phosphoribosyltransferase regulatory subunit [Anaerotalea alkaliphila]
MNDRLLHTPEGVRDIHCNETATKVEIENRILSVFHRHGFKQVQTPSFEYFDVYARDQKTTDARMMYRFFDRDGSILCLRPDITPSIARFASVYYGMEHTPKRFAYLGNTYRNNESYQLKLKEFTQAGVELIGEDLPDADAETVAMAVNGFLATGLTEFQIDLGHAGFFRGLVEEAGIGEEYLGELLRLVDEKNYIALEELLESLSIGEELKETLLQLPKFFGQVEVLEQARKSTKNPKSLAALDRLEQVYEILKSYEVDRYISFDLGMVSQTEYYTGIIFRGFTFGTGVSIVDGGRYDSLLASFGMDAPAIGFAILIDELLNALERQKIQIPIPQVDTLLLYAPETRATAVKVAQTLRMDGMSIETGLLGADFDTNLAYGRKNNIGGIMQFVSQKEVHLTNIGTGKKDVVDVDALLGQLQL